MKAVFLIFFSLSVAALVAATSDSNKMQLQKVIGTSPDGKYSVRTGENSQLGYVYQLINAESDETILSLKSSYQPTGPDDRRSALQTTQSASIYWSSDSRFVAVNEYNLRFKGTVLAAWIVSSEEAREIVVPVEEIQRISGERWSQVRVSVKQGWMNGGILDLTIDGKAFQDKVKGTALFDGLIGYDVRVKMIQSFSVTSVLGTQ